MGNCCSDRNRIYISYNFSDIDICNNQMIEKKLKIKEFRNKFPCFLNEFDQHFMIHISKQRADLIQTIFKYITLQNQDLTHTDIYGNNFLFYILTNKYTKIQTIKDIQNLNIYSNVSETLYSNINNEGYNFLIYAMNSENKNIQIINHYIKTIPIAQLEKCITRDNSILSLCIEKQENNLFNSILSRVNELTTRNFIKSPYRYINVFHMALQFNEEMAIKLLTSGFVNKFNIDVVNTKYILNNVQLSVFSYACLQNYEQYVLYALEKKLFTQDCIENNIFFLVNILDDDTLKKYILNNVITFSSINKRNCDGYNIFTLSIKNKTNLYQWLIENHLLNKTINVLDKYGNNPIMIASLYNLDALLVLYNLYTSYPNILFHRNYNGYDFMDILTYITKPPYEYYVNFFSTEYYDSKKDIIDVFCTMKPILVSKYVFLRYQYNSTVPQLSDNDIDESENECPICMADIANIKLNCQQKVNHTVCFKCSLLIDKCPICRHEITSKTFLVDV
jgi:hypothetical protein